MRHTLVDAKFHGLADPVPGSAATARPIAACWELGNAPELRSFAALAAPH